MLLFLLFEAPNGLFKVKSVLMQTDGPSLSGESMTAGGPAARPLVISMRFSQTRPGAGQ